MFESVISPKEVSRNKRRGSRWRCFRTVRANSKITRRLERFRDIYTLSKSQCAKVVVLAELIIEGGGLEITSSSCGTMADLFSDCRRLIRDFDDNGAWTASLDKAIAILRQKAQKPESGHRRRRWCLAVLVNHLSGVWRGSGFVLPDLFVFLVFTDFFKKC